MIIFFCFRLQKLYRGRLMQLFQINHLQKGNNAGHGMVFILDGCSFYYTHTWSKSGISIWWRHLAISKEWSNPIFFLGKYLFLHHACTSCSEQPSNIKTMIVTYYIKWITTSCTDGSQQDRRIIVKVNNKDTCTVHWTATN